MEVYTTQSPSPTFTTSPPFPVQLSLFHNQASPTIFISVQNTHDIGSEDERRFWRKNKSALQDQILEYCILRSKLQKSLHLGISYIKKHKKSSKYCRSNSDPLIIPASANYQGSTYWKSDQESLLEEGSCPKLSKRF